MGDDSCLCVGVLYLYTRTDILFEKLGLDWNLCFLHGHPWLYAFFLASSMRCCVFSVSLASFVSVSLPHSCNCDACIDTLQSAALRVPWWYLAIPTVSEDRLQHKNSYKYWRSAWSYKEICATPMKNPWSYAIKTWLLYWVNLFCLSWPARRKDKTKASSTAGLLWRDSSSFLFKSCMISRNVSPPFPSCRRHPRASFEIHSS